MTSLKSFKRLLIVHICDVWSHVFSQYKRELSGSLCHWCTSSHGVSLSPRVSGSPCPHLRPACRPLRGPGRGRLLLYRDSKGRWWGCISLRLIPGHGEASFLTFTTFSQFTQDGELNGSPIYKNGAFYIAMKDDGSCWGISNSHWLEPGKSGAAINSYTDERKFPCSRISH